LKAHARLPVDYDAKEVSPLPVRKRRAGRKMERVFAVALDGCYSVLVFAFCEVGHVRPPVRLDDFWTRARRDSRGISGGGSGGVG
jgi:hypothetical protein